MLSLIELQKKADLLSEEDRAGLAAHLLASFSAPPLGANNDEIDRRDLDLDSGEVVAISHEEFLLQVGR